MPPVFVDRRDAGRRLAGLLRSLASRPRAPTGESAPGADLVPGAATEPADQVVVLGLPRGGVPVAAEVASALRARLDVLVVGKVGVPGHEELALAAVADDGTIALNPGVIAAVGMTADDVEALARRHAAALARRGAVFRGGRPAAPLAGRTVVVVDDGMATGATMRVAVEVVRRRGPRRLVVAVPVASPEAVSGMRGIVDQVTCVSVPPGFRAVGPWYQDFTQVTDDEVRALLAPAVNGGGPRPPGRPGDR